MEKIDIYDIDVIRLSYYEFKDGYTNSIIIKPNEKITEIIFNDIEKFNYYCTYGYIHTGNNYIFIIKTTDNTYPSIICYDEMVNFGENFVEKVNFHEDKIWLKYNIKMDIGSFPATFYNGTRSVSLSSNPTIITKK